MDMPPLVQLEYTDADGNVISKTTQPQVIPEALWRLVRPFELKRSVDLAIVREMGIGDVLMTTPTIREIATKYPNLDITYYTQPRTMPILEGNPYITTLRDVAEFNEEEHELAIVLSQYVERHPCAAIDSRAHLFGKAFGLDLTDHSLDIFLTKEELWTAKQELAHLPRPLIGIAPHAADPVRDWKYAEDSIAKLSEIGSVVWFSWLEPAPKGVHVIGQQHINRQWAAAIAQLDVFVCVDSGPMHMASAVQKYLRNSMPAIVALTGLASNKLVLRGCKRYLESRDNTLECSPCMNNRVAGCTGQCQEFHTVERVLSFVQAAFGDNLRIAEIAKDRSARLRATPEELVMSAERVRG